MLKYIIKTEIVKVPFGPLRTPLTLEFEVHVNVPYRIIE